MLVAGLMLGVSVLALLDLAIYGWSEGVHLVSRGGLLRSAVVLVGALFASSRVSKEAPTFKLTHYRRLAQNSPTLSTTPNERPRRASGKLPKIKAAPVAQVDRAAVS